MAVLDTATHAVPFPSAMLVTHKQGPTSSAPPQPLTPPEFAARLDPLGPFEPRPTLAVAVSGGADSTALALLAADWASARGGHIHALIVDHGLRPAAAAEAAETAERLAARKIPARILTLHNLPHGPALAARARTARLAALTGAATQAGILHLLLGHHAADQAETILMRQRAHSGPAGLAGIAALVERPDLRLLRPLLDIPPDRLRATLRAHRMPWIEDPSNHNPAATRSRLRAELTPPASHALIDQARQSGAARTRRDIAIAQELADRARISPLGYALLSPGPITPEALSALWQAVSGRPYPPPSTPIARLAATQAPATLAGLRLLPAGAQGRGWLLVRETAPKPVPAHHNAPWDRFRLQAPAGLPHGLTIAAQGPAPAALRARTTLPDAVLRTLPALWSGSNLAAAPCLDWGDIDARFLFTPAQPAAGAPWHQGLAEFSTERDA